MTSGRQYVDEAAALALPTLGFRRSKGRYRLALIDGVEGRIGLNTGNIALGTVSVHPSIAVNHRAIEREIVNREGQGDIDNATIVAHLGEVGPHPEVPDLIVNSKESAQDVLDYIVDRLTRYGIPWMREMATVVGLAAGLERFIAIEPEFRRPIAYRELGRPDLAIESIDRTLEAFDGLPNDGTVGRFRVFAGSLRPELVARLDGSGDIAGH